MMIVLLEFGRRRASKFCLNFAYLLFLLIYTCGLIRGQQRTTLPAERGFVFYHEHSYNYYPRTSPLPKDSSTRPIVPSTTFTPFLLTNETYTDCNVLFDKCLCSFNEPTNRNFLYCNDPNIRRIPDFKTLYAVFDKQIKPKYPDKNLVFTKVDFSGSSIRHLRKEDLNFLQLDLLPNSVKSSTVPSSTSKLDNNLNNSSEIEALLDQLITKQAFVPIYHLEFDNIVEIDDGAFVNFLDNSISLSYELASSSASTSSIITTTPSIFDMSLWNRSLPVSKRNENLLKVRFSNSKLDFAPTRKPFMGLRSLEFHLNNFTNEYLPNSVFDQSVISEFYIENSPNFIGFIDMSSTMPTGKLLHKFVVIKSYKVDQLCSHSLPSFIHQETFHDITIKKCGNLRHIKPFTFYKYPHLKTLVLSSNNITQIDKDSFRFLSELQLLDLSSNPIGVIEDNSFRDMSSLRTLYLDSTKIKNVYAKTFSGLFNLVELKLSKSSQLEHIHPKAFQDSTFTLRELHLKDTRMRLMDVIDSDDGLDPPYLAHVDYKFKPTWLDNLNLTLLNMESVFGMDQYNDSSARLMCKALRLLPKHTLIHLQRHQPCTCMVYFFYRLKKFPLYPRWEFKTPFCYRNQIQSIVMSDGSIIKSMEKLVERETECQLSSLDAYCFPPPTTTTTTTTTTSTTTTSTTTSTTTTTTTTRTTSRRRTFKTRTTPSSRHNDPSAATPVVTTKKRKAASFPKIDPGKLIKVTH